MSRFVLLEAAIVISLSLATLPVSAQGIGRTPLPHLHATNPSLSLSTQPTSPVQQQMQLDYRGNLLSAQRDLLQSNPSGLSREQIAIGHQLDGYNAMPR
jgi:hypothetical protein